VTIPYNRLNLKYTPQDTPQDVSLVREDTTEKKILEFCTKARSVQEMLLFLGLKDRKNLMVYIAHLLEQGRIARTIPDKPKSKNQKYLTIR